METDDLSFVGLFFEWAEASLWQLKDNLSSIGYEFQRGCEPLQTTRSDLGLSEIERRFGQLPMAYRMLYQRLCFVDFRQAGSQLHRQGDELAGLGLNCPLVFTPLFRIDELRTEIASCGGVIESNGRSFLPTGSVASNCEPKGIWVPCAEIDPVLFDEGAGPVSLMADLKNAILAGGFPFWQLMFRRRRHISPLGFSPAYPKLLPQLLRGIEQPPTPRS